MGQPPELLELLKFLKFVEMDECQDCVCLISLLSGRKMTSRCGASIHVTYTGNGHYTASPLLGHKRAQGNVPIMQFAQVQRVPYLRPHISQESLKVTQRTSQLVSDLISDGSFPISDLAQRPAR